MSLAEAKFDNEKELDIWVQDNIETFLPGAEFLSPIYISTTTGKKGLPDGFAYNLISKEWYLIECELLRHGVWTHIAEQVTRFVVAMQNPQSRRILRNHIFEDLSHKNQIENACKIFDTSPERLLQQLELFVEGIEPQFVIIIDDTNQDLKDMANALSAEVKIFRLKKLISGDKTEYYSPDKNIPVVETERPMDNVSSISEFDVVDSLGGGELDRSIGRFKCYRMVNGDVIHIKRSKYHQIHNNYWYGITPISLEYCSKQQVTHLSFIMGDEGFVNIPIQTVLEFIKNTNTSSTTDGAIRHYHVLISPGPEPVLYYSNDVPKFPLKDYYQTK